MYLIYILAHLFCFGVCDEWEGGASHDHTQKLVQEVKVQEVHLREGGVQEGEGVDDQDSMRQGLLEECHEEVPNSLQGGQKVGVVSSMNNAS